MITKNEVITKLDELKRYSVAVDPATESLFQPVYSAISSYFSSSSSELVTALEDVVKYMYNDISRRTTEYENNFEMNLASNFPDGYDDITKCFYTFTELLTVDKNTFNDAFVYGIPATPASDEGGGAAEPIPVSNPYLDRWTSEITSAITGDLDKVKNLAEWCKNSGGSCDLVCLLEVQGQVTKSKPMKEIATIIYQDRKLLDVISSRGLKVYIPSWMT